MTNIAIVTDSTADLPSELIQQHAIHVIPNIIVVGGKSLEDGKGISRTEFYKQLPYMKTPPTTATAATGVYQQLYQELFANGNDQIISIHTSHLLSGIYNAASVAAQAFSGRVKVIDSHSVSLGLGFQVMAAAEAATKKPLEAVLQIIEEIRGRIRLVAMLDTLEYVRRSGRVSWARARLGEILRIKPFIEVVSGKVNSLGEVRTRKKGINRLVTMLDALGPLERLAILHTNAPDDAQRVLNVLQNTPARPPLIVNVTTIIGAHVGPNALGFTAVTG